MFGHGSLYKIGLALLVSLPVTAFAGRWSQKCEADGRKATAACKAAGAGATTADNIQAAGNIAGAGSYANQNPGAAAEKGQALDQVGRLQGAKKKCEEEKEKCSKECDDQETDRKNKANLPPIPAPKGPPIKQEAEADAGQVEQKKQSACVAPIMALLGEIGSGLGDAAKAAGEAGKTGSSSGGMPLPIPIPLPGDKKGDETGQPPVAQDPAADPLKCDTAGYQRYSDCNNHYIEKCGGSMEANGCSEFINRYCGNYTPPTPSQNSSPSGNDNVSINAQSSTSTTGAAAAATANLVADKQGEGLGSNFCKKANAYRYCQMAGRSECPSCKNLNNPWPTQGADQMADAQRTCPTDPMFMDAAVQQQLNSGTPTLPASTNSAYSTQSARDRLSGGTGAASGLGGGSLGGQNGGAGGAGAAPGATNGAVAEGYNGPSLAMGTGYGGGGGGSFEGSASGPGYDPQSVDPKTNRAPASASLAAQGGPADVAHQFGPSIFSIQSTTYREMCSRGRFLHCRR